MLITGFSSLMNQQRAQKALDFRRIVHGKGGVWKEGGGIGYLLLLECVHGIPIRIILEIGLGIKGGEGSS